jgi:ATP-dependent Lon protease
MKHKDKPFGNVIVSDMMEDDTVEMIPLLSPEEEEEIDKYKIPDELPILPVKNTVLFPGVVIPITVSRQKSIRLVKKAYKGNRIIGVVAQANALKEDPAFEDLYKGGNRGPHPQDAGAARRQYHHHHPGQAALPDDRSVAGRPLPGWPKPA